MNKTNDLNKYLLQTEEGITIDSCRLKITAIIRKDELEDIYKKKVKIIKVK